MKLLFKQRLFSWFDSYDKVIEKLVTDAAGHAESGLYEIATYKNGEFGDPIKYYLVETKALDGYTLDSTQHEIVFEYVDQNTPIIEVIRKMLLKIQTLRAIREAILRPVMKPISGFQLH